MHQSNYSFAQIADATSQNDPPAFFSSYKLGNPSSDLLLQNHQVAPLPANPYYTNQDQPMYRNRNDKHQLEYLPSTQFLFYDNNQRHPLTVYANEIAQNNEMRYHGGLQNFLPKVFRSLSYYRQKSFPTSWNQMFDI